MPTEPALPDVDRSPFDGMTAHIAIAEKKVPAVNGIVGVLALAVCVAGLDAALRLGRPGLTVTAVVGHRGRRRVARLLPTRARVGGAVLRTLPRDVAAPRPGLHRAVDDPAPNQRPRPQFRDQPAAGQ